MTHTLEQLHAHLLSASVTEINGRTYRGQLPRINCGDGTTMSVQVGRGLYCCPRDDEGPWHEVEVGFPSKEITLLNEYAEEPRSPTKTVYGYVPVEVVAQAIDACGGMAAS